jgi:hypothetical protein
MCRGTVAVPKEYNVRRNFESKYSDLTKLNANKNKVLDFLENLSGQQ